MGAFFIFQTKTPCFHIVLMFGTAQASDFEPLEAISDWLLSNPDLEWMKEIREASRTKFVQQYQL